MKAELRPGERLDDLQINDYYIIQNPDKFYGCCFAVFLCTLCTGQQSC